MHYRPSKVKKQKAAFLANLATTGDVSASCKASGLPRSTAYEWRDADPEFRAEWEKAQDQGTDALEDEAIRRGREGFEEPVFYQGVPVGTVRKYSDALLTFMLKGRRPEKFKDRVANELSGSVGLTHEQRLAQLDELK